MRQKNKSKKWGLLTAAVVLACGSMALPQQAWATVSTTTETTTTEDTSKNTNSGSTKIISNEEELLSTASLMGASLTASTANVVYGNDNVVSGNTQVVYGIGNTVGGVYQHVVVGYDNTIRYPSDLTNPTDVLYTSTIVGQGNVVEQPIAMIVGWHSQVLNPVGYEDFCTGGTVLGQVSTAFNHGATAVGNLVTASGRKAYSFGNGEELYYDDTVTGKFFWGLTDYMNVEVEGRYLANGLQRNVASGEESVAVGFQNQATGTGSVAIGSSEGLGLQVKMTNIANGKLTADSRWQYIAHGEIVSEDEFKKYLQIASGTRSMAMGTANHATGDGSLAFGRYNEASASDSMAIGTGGGVFDKQTASGVNSMVIGAGNKATQDRRV